MEIGNVIKAATFKSSLHQSYKRTPVAFLVTVHFNYFHDANLNRLCLGVTQKQELHVRNSRNSQIELFCVSIFQCPKSEI